MRKAEWITAIGAVILLAIAALVMSPGTAGAVEENGAISYDACQCQYESYENMRADITKDCRVNWDDFFALARHYLQTWDNPAYDEAADIDRSGQVNIVDFGILARWWGWVGHYSCRVAL